MRTCDQEIRLQRLIDGALNANERRDFLCQLDKESPRWREVALAFVEEQIWREEVSSACQPRSENLSPHEGQHIGGKGNSRPRPSNRFALAACLIAGISIGALCRPFQANRFGDSLMTTRPLDGQVARGSRQESITPDMGTFVRDKSGPIGQLRLVPTLSPAEDLLSIPVYDETSIQDLDPLSDQRTDWQLANQDLMSAGYQLDWDDDYLQAQLDDGKTIIIPVRTISMQPFGQ